MWNATASRKSTTSTRWPRPLEPPVKLLGRAVMAGAHRRRDDENAPAHESSSVPASPHAARGLTARRPSENGCPAWSRRHARARHRGVWLVGVRDLQFRRRRFLIAALATSVVFAMTADHGGHEQRPRPGGRPDRRLVRRRPLGGRRRGVGTVHRDQVRRRRRHRSACSAPRGVRAASPMIAARATIGTELAHRREPARLRARRGRRADDRRRTGAEAGRVRSLVDGSLDEDVGDRRGRQRQARARRRQGRRPPVQLRRPHDLHDGSTTPRTSRSPDSLSPARWSRRGSRVTVWTALHVLTNAEVEGRPAAAGSERQVSRSTSSRLLLWIVAAGIIALDRVPHRARARP